MVEEGADFKDVVRGAVETAARGIQETPDFNIDSLTDYSKMKDTLVMQVVSTESNAELLSTIPHKEMEDMSVIYRFMVMSGQDEMGSIVVTNNMMDMMKVTPEQLHADAVENSPKLKPAEITGMSEIIAQMMGPEMAEMMGIIPDDPADEQMFVASTPDKIHGAGVLAYQDFMDQAAERVGGSFFILPSSVHEVILVPDNGNMGTRELEDMVCEVNATQVVPEEKLTDNVYHYDAQDKVFELGEKFVERQATKEEMAAEKAEAKDTVLGDLKAKKEEVAKQPKKDTPDKAVNKNKGGDAL